MEIVKQASAAVFNFGASLGAFLIPCVILCSVALMLFAKYSYKLFKIVLPLAGVVLGSLLGASLIGPMIKGISGFVNPALVAGAVCAAVLAFLCFKLHKFTVFVIGASCGYILVGRIVKDLLLDIPFIFQLSETVERPITMTVGIIIGLICLAVTAVVVKKFFRSIYVIATSVGGAAASLGIASVFVFAGTTIADVATVTALGLGAIIGLVFCAKQLSDIYYE